MTRVVLLFKFGSVYIYKCNLLPFRFHTIRTFPVAYLGSIPPWAIKLVLPLVYHFIYDYFIININYQQIYIHVPFNLRKHLLLKLYMYFRILLIIKNTLSKLDLNFSSGLLWSQWINNIRVIYISHQAVFYWK